MKEGITPLWNRNIWNWLSALRDSFITIVIYYDTSGSCAAFLLTSSYCYYCTSITADAATPSLHSFSRDPLSSYYVWCLFIRTRPRPARN